MVGPATDEIRHRRLDPDGEEPAVQVAKYVAEISGVPAGELESTWETFDHVVDDIFSNPPAPEAQVQVTFTYEGFRITVTQDGHATFVPVHDPSIDIGE